MIDRMRVVPRDPRKEIGHLSGGNQQKVVVGRWLAVDPRVILFDEPTQGVDVGTKAQMYKLIMDLACEGRAIILISSEFAELVNLADRILVVKGGRVASEIPAAQTNVDTLFRACMKEGAA